MQLLWCVCISGATFASAYFILHLPRQVFFGQGTFPMASNICHGIKHQQRQASFSQATVAYRRHVSISRGRCTSASANGRQYLPSPLGFRQMTSPSDKYPRRSYIGRGLPHQKLPMHIPKMTSGMDLSH
uniref:Uncharacterized protein n=1 Tax=Solanum lycopersicum TaxID=4081 RepID=K4BZ13_SOLLC